MNEDNAKFENNLNIKINNYHKAMEKYELIKKIGEGYSYISLSNI
jgi:hypothetical protein